MANLNQVRRLRIAAKRAGWRVVLRGSGYETHIHLYGPKSKLEAHLVIWYPWEGRANNLEEQDAERVIAELEAGGDPA